MRAQLNMWHDSLICVIWLICMCDTTYWYAWGRVHMCDMTYSQVLLDSFYVWHELQVILRKRATNYRALLQKMTYNSKASYRSSPPSMCEMNHSYVWNDSFICMTWLIHVWDVTHSHVCYCSFICVTWPESFIWHDSFIRVTWPIYMRDMTHSHVWHDWFICVTVLIVMYEESFICVTWFIHMCDMTHSYVRHDSFTCVTWLI